MNTDIDPPADPWALFATWYALACKQETSYPDVMMLATMGSDGMPSLRAVLMKSFDNRGIVFHTNRESRKGRELAAHDQASICFYWKSLQRQIRIEGIVTMIADAESDAYFATRPRASQIGAWASQQSRPYDTRSDFERRIAEIEKQFQGRDVPRPPHWGGYRLAPDAFEFWQECDFRLHDRVTYRAQPGAGQWNIQRLYP